MPNRAAEFWEIKVSELMSDPSTSAQVLAHVVYRVGAGLEGIVAEHPDWLQSPGDQIRRALPGLLQVLGTVAESGVPELPEHGDLFRHLLGRHIHDFDRATDEAMDMARDQVLEGQAAGFYAAAYWNIIQRVVEFVYDWHIDTDTYLLNHWRNLLVSIALAMRLPRMTFEQRIAEFLFEQELYAREAEWPRYDDAPNGPLLLPGVDSHATEERLRRERGQVSTSELNAAMRWLIGS